MLELMKMYLYDNHDNNSTIMYFFAQKITQFQMLAETTIFNFKTLNFVR